MTQETAITQLKQLVDTFDQHRSEYIRRSSTYNETELRNDFLNPFLQILGWDVQNTKGVPQYLREVVHEDTVEITDEEENVQKKPDYALRMGTVRKFFIEAKKPSVPIESHQSSAFQVRRYGWNAGMSVSVLTNFDKLIIYDCHFRPLPQDDTHVARRRIYSYTEYVERFDEIFDQLSRDTVYSGRFDQLFPLDKEQQGTETFDRYFLTQIERWRLLLSRDIAERNPKLQQSELNYVVQMLLNRIIFLRVCEDRELEKYRSLQKVQNYDELKALFHAADRRYNSGLFDFIEDTLSLDIDVQSTVLLPIFKELYYPESPYAFSVVEAGMLGEIYELFLAKEIRIDGEVRVVDKPEVVASGGVVSTPQYVVDNIISRTLVDALAGKSPSDITSFHIADIACGSGTFLLEAYEYLLNYYLEWYLADGAKKHKNRVFESSENQWRLSLQEKQRILQQHIFGVDIDSQAVEVTRFSLLLKVLENETAASVDALLKSKRLRALPNINQNICWGNSLLDEDYFEYDPDALSSYELTLRLNPFVWNEIFPGTMARGGFDVIVGNPPYVRIQNMVQYSPEEVEYYQSDESPYTTAKSDNFDKYSLFIERALSLLKPNGILGYIVPHKFFVLKSGQALRRLLSGRNCVSEITHFGVEQVFGKRTATYTCILILKNRSEESFVVEHVSDLSGWKYGAKGIERTYGAGQLSDKPWVFVSPQAEALFERLRAENPTRLKDVAEVLVGLQTSSDKVYIIRPTEQTETTVCFTDFRGKAWEIEKGILRPCIYKAELSAFSRVQPNAYIIFPYEVVEETACVYSTEEMETLFPNCWRYLNEYKQRLISRDVQGITDDTWYRYGRSQSLTKFEVGEKLIWSTLTLVPRYAYDNQSTLFTGGGNGPYYGLRMRDEAPVSIFFIQAILSHPAIELMVSTGASEFRGGYKSHGKQFMDGLPIRLVDEQSRAEKKTHDEIVSLVQKLTETTEKISLASVPKEKESLRRYARRINDRLQQLVEQLYGIGKNELQSIPELVTLSEPTS